MQENMTFSQALDKLGQVGISHDMVYLIDLVILAQMAWADGSVQDAECALLYDYLNRHITHINRLAGYQLINPQAARDFVHQLAVNKPSKHMLETIHQVLPALYEHKNIEEAEQKKKEILDACLDIASSSVINYPYGLRERFSEEEKACYHQLVELLCRKEKS